MSRAQTLVKVYAHVWPFAPGLRAALEPLLPPASMLSEGMLPEEVLEEEGDLLRLSFAGLYFPLDDVLRVLHAHLCPQSQGKLDHLDLEAWTLTRYRISGTSFTTSTAPLNSVLDYSGH